MSTSIMWFRRDLRLADNPALCAAAGSGEVVPVFVLDPHLLASAGRRRQRLLASLAVLRAETGGALVIRTGDPTEVIPALAAEVGADEVHVSAETTPYGRRRDDAAAQRLAESGSRLVATGSPYAVTPGRIQSQEGRPYRVFTPFAREWRSHGWRRPMPRPDVIWATGVAGDRVTGPTHLPGVGEAAALKRWSEFLEQDLAGYGDRRDRPDLDRTSRLSIALKYGEIHPRTLLDDLDRRRDDIDPASIDRFEAELAWREFYADVLWHSPRSRWRDWREDRAQVRYDHDPELIDTWRHGRTGFPFVDAGMRQLLSQGWMHNRLRMVCASFLVKDLHVWWPHGARHFLEHLLDGDVASNNHGWQWVAGTGTDAAPYFRVFNPVTQGLRFDPEGEFVRRWVPELRHLPGAAAHEPWRHPDGYTREYPPRIVDHGVEREEALARWADQGSAA
ncbi:MAG TPA: deoxyribodipyrimidine photo-lyase [Aeromicrobium sp.]|nr:deoxyribodipyrimidine photo-lyase [Aeromicrobium sp.]HKY57589.1 deoxyribodipyrimidine photo-lyase [Aeromicrobium sp.]